MPEAIEGFICPESILVEALPRVQTVSRPAEHKDVAGLWISIRGFSGCANRQIITPIAIEIPRG
jgi:hypothetical protein